MASHHHVHLTSEMVRALAHPLRMRLLGMLRVDGPATATKLAERCETNSGATSYHLRQLAEIGLIEEDPRPSSGRERWWKAAHGSMSWRDTEHHDDPESKAAADWLMRSTHRTYGRWVDDWHDARSEWPIAWQDAVDQSDLSVHLTPERLAELNRRVHELVNEYDDPEHPESQAVVVLYYSLPQAAIQR